MGHKIEDKASSVFRPASCALFSADPSSFLNTYHTTVEMTGVAAAAAAAAAVQKMQSLHDVTTAEELSSVLSLLKACHPTGIYAENLCSVISQLPSMNFIKYPDGEFIKVLKDIEGDPNKFALVIWRYKMELKSCYHMFCSETIVNKEAVFDILATAVDWTKPAYFEFVPLYLKDMIRTKMLSTDSNSMDFELLFDCHLLPKELKAQDMLEAFPNDPAITVDYLKPENADTVASAWKYAHSDAKAMVQHQTTAKLGFGVFKSDELVSWGIIHRIGCVSLVHTKEGHRGQGLAKRLYAFAAKRAQELALPLIAYVEVDNVASSKLHAAVGMRICKQFVCFSYEPKE